MIMKRTLLVLAAAGLTAACGAGEARIDRTHEDGVEVVLNHREPYRIKGQPSTFLLDEVLVIDLERVDLAEAGLLSGGEWDSDSAGNITVVGFKNRENYIYRFDGSGQLIGSFGRRGQGPGELQWPFFSGVSEDGEAVITDFGVKFVVYDRNGVVLREERLGRQTIRLEALGNGKYLAFRPRPDLMTANAVVDELTLCDGEFRDLKVLDRYERTMDNAKQVPFFMWRVSGGRIIVANQARGYELWVFDLDGNLIRKIRKEYRPIRVTEDIKEAVLGPSSGRAEASQGRYFPDPLPPLNQFFTDDQGRIFVMTYEPGPAPGEFLWDIFNADGAFVGRKALDVLWAGLYAGPRYTFIKNGRFYFHRVKETGYHELVVSKVTWR
jgi:hypothetical protein